MRGQKVRADSGCAPHPSRHLSLFLSLAPHAGDWGEGEARAAARPGEEDEEGGGEDDGEVYGDFEDLETGARLSAAVLCCAVLF